MSCSQTRKIGSAQHFAHKHVPVSLMKLFQYWSHATSNMKYTPKKFLSFQNTDHKEKRRKKYQQETT